MRRLFVFIGLCFLSGGLPACAAPQDDLSAIPQPFETASVPSHLAPSHPGYVAEMEPGRDAKPPSGYLDFCDRNPGECRTPRDRSGKVAFTPEIESKLKTVNAAVNSTVRPMDDEDHYGVTEFWTVPTDGEGDCEDYVLAKRKMLILLGLPESALRITVALDSRRVRHAVLTIVTDRGDYVLDNMRDDITSPEQTDYIWVSRQDFSSRTGWIAMDQPRLAGR